MPSGNNPSVVDDLDFAILSLLQKDGRTSFTEIANELGTAVGTIRNRVTRLLEDGTLHIVGRVNPYRVGFNSPATILVSIEPDCIENAIAEISEFPEVSYISMITGEFELMVDVMCRDSDHLSEFLVHNLSKVRGIKSYRTSIILRLVKYVQPDLQLARSQSIGAEHEHKMR